MTNNPILVEVMPITVTSWPDGTLYIVHTKPGTNEVLCSDILSTSSAVSYFALLLKQFQNQPKFNDHGLN